MADRPASARPDCGRSEALALSQSGGSARSRGSILRGFGALPENSIARIRLVFLPFFALGLFFVVMVFREAIASAATYTWQSVPCQIVESGVRESSEPFPWFAYLRYTWSAGESVRSSRLFQTYHEAVLFTRRWPPAPAQPAIWILAIRRARCSNGKARASRCCCSSRSPCSSYSSGPLDSTASYFVCSRTRASGIPANPLAGRRFAAGLLIVVGLVLFLAFLLGPVRHAIAARSWRAQECKILRSEVQRYATSEGSDTYSPEILYSYLVDGHEHRSDIYSFFEFSSSGRAAAERITSGYRPGSTVTCYVNPADPDDATLNRDPSLGWLIGLLPLAMLAGGLSSGPAKRR